MGKTWEGRSYNEDWEPLGDYGVVIGPKDWAANAAYAAATQTQNPYTNEAGASPYDKSGLVPGNEPGSTLPRVSGTASRTPAYVTQGQWTPLASLIASAAPKAKAAQAPTSGAKAPTDINTLPYNTDLIPVASPRSGSKVSRDEPDWIDNVVSGSGRASVPQRRVTETSVAGGEGVGPVSDDGDLNALEALMRILSEGAVSSTARPQRRSE